MLNELSMKMMNISDIFWQPSNQFWEVVMSTANLAKCLRLFVISQIL